MIKQKDCKPVDNVTSIIYPKYKPVTKPTPADKLAICNTCLNAHWTMYCNITLYCSKCLCRLREATKQEYVAANAFIKTQNR